MTRQYQERKPNPDGTVQHIQTPFGKWIRGRPDLDSVRQRTVINDCDYWVHRYRSKTDKIGFRVFDLFFHLEVKSNGARMNFSQDDTFFLLDQLLRKAVTASNGNHITLELLGPDGNTRLVKCYGTHVLRLSGNAPDDSKEMWWDDKPITSDELMGVLKFERNPDKPWKMMGESLRRHHAAEVDLNYNLFGNSMK